MCLDVNDGLTTSLLWVTRLVFISSIQGTELVTTPETLAQGITGMRVDVVAYALVVTVSTDMSQSLSAYAFRLRQSCLNEGIEHMGK